MRQVLSRSAVARVLFLASLVVAVGCDSGNNNPMSGGGGGGAGVGGDGGGGGTDPIAGAVECERAVIQELVPYDATDNFVFDFEVPEQFIFLDDPFILGTFYELDLAEGQAPPQMEIQIRQAPGLEMEPDPVIQDAYAQGADNLVVFKYDGIDVALVGQESGGVLGGFMYLPFGGEHIRVDVQFVDTSGECSTEREDIMNAFVASLKRNENTAFPNLM
ncbi:MAG: hypothetical protein JRF42_05555 [Deltaproteobacteria bacterium]|nr:hypothetical protein [Deltaproteobacteria bacterium]